MRWSRWKGLVGVGLAALLGGVLGHAYGAARVVMGNYNIGPVAFLAEPFPLPHHVPARADGVAFRFAMVHDILVERYPKHDPAYYQAREAEDRSRLARLGPDDPARFPLLDDLGVDLARLGRHDEAIALMRGKLDSQTRAGQTGRDLYTTDADLGTFLIHANLGAALGGDRLARERFGEGVDFIRRSVAVNPDAHFGRERWQLVVGEFLAAVMGDPGLLTRFDCLGNGLNRPFESLVNRDADWSFTGYGRPNTPAFGQWKAAEVVPLFFVPGVRVEDPTNWAKLGPIRQYVTRIGAEEGWDKVPIPDHRVPVAFDEPMLGIVGMWRLGGGANPHFALAIGETMLRVGQRRIAWEAYERAASMADRYSIHEVVRAWFRDHCRRRQADIEATLNYHRQPNERHPWQEVSPPRDDDAPEQLRARFAAELAFGLARQDEYQDFERARLAPGVRFADAQLTDHGPMPTPSRPGPEEWYMAVTRPALERFGPDYRLATAICGAGAFAFVAALFIRLRDWVRSLDLPANVESERLQA